MKLTILAYWPPRLDDESNHLKVCYVERFKDGYMSGV